MRVSVPSRDDDLASRDRAPRRAALGVPLALALLALLGASALGCARDARWALLSLDPLEGLTRLDAGRVYELTGRGFPVGREVEVSLDGVLHAPLGARRRVGHVLLGRTATPERLTFSASDADVAALGGRGTFVGSLEVRVRGAILDGVATRVVGRLEGVTLDLVPSEGGSRAGLGRAGAGGLALADLLGVTIEPIDAPDALGDEDELDEPEEREADAGSAQARGARVASRDGAGAAARLGLDGLAPGARIVAIEGMRVLDPAELRVSDAASHVALDVIDREGRLRRVEVDLDAARGRASSEATREDQLAVIVLVAALLFGAWPLGRARARGPEPASPKPHVAVLTSAFAVLVVLVASTLGGAGAPSERIVPIWLGASILLRLVAAFVGWGGAPASLGGSSPGRASRVLPRAARDEAWLALFFVLAATIAVGAFIATRGSALAAGLPPDRDSLASAAWMPMAWPLARQPFGPVALLALFAAASATRRAVAHPTTRGERLLRGLDDLGLAALASTFVRVAVADPSSHEPITRASALVATVALFAGLLHARRRVRARASIRAAACLASGLATLALTLAWLGAGARVSDPSFERAVAEVVLVCVGLVVVRVATLGQRVAGEPPPAGDADATQAANRPPRLA